MFLFYLFFEITLIPMYFLIGVWGGERRIYAAIKFFIYTVVGSLLMLVAIIAVYQYAGGTTFDIAEITSKLNSNPNLIPANVKFWLWAAFALAFFIKVPLWPLHTWLPDAHVEAPTAGSVILASILLKMGTYGFLRFSLPMLPDAAKDPKVISVVAILSIIGIVYGALASLMQKDWKKLVAYSSVSHLGFCTLGIIALNPAGIAGSMLQQINHGISTGMLFLIVGIVYERRHTREITEYGGLSKAMPVFTLVFLLAALSSMGMPPLNGFIGEITVVQGAYQISFNWAFWCVVGIALGAAYLLWLFQRTMFGELGENNRGIKDLSWREIAVFAPLLVWAFWIGLAPQGYFRVLDRSVAHIVERVQPGYYAAHHLPNPLDGVQRSANSVQPVGDRLSTIGVQRRK
jgi:NADH-quinone oxidoreductase subunit M